MAGSVFLLLLAGTLLCGLLFHTVSQNEAGDRTRSRRPNFIIILADDIGWGDLGANQQVGQRSSQTPHLDLMAQQGMRYSSC